MDGAAPPRRGSDPPPTREAPNRKNVRLREISENLRSFCIWTARSSFIGPELAGGKVRWCGTFPLLRRHLAAGRDARPPQSLRRAMPLTFVPAPAGMSRRPRHPAGGRAAARSQPAMRARRPRRAAQAPGFEQRGAENGDTEKRRAAKEVRQGGVGAKEGKDGKRVAKKGGKYAAAAPAEVADAEAPAAKGITRDDRLREELQHPFRRPKLVIFGTLALSATVGTLFATGRLLLGADAVDVYAVNMAVNAPAIALFVFLAKREADFGRRSLGVLARCPEARDLPLGGRLRVGGAGGAEVLHVVAGRARDVAEVLLRTDVTGVSLVAVAVDAGRLDQLVLGPRVWAPELEDDPDSKTAWDAWLEDVNRPRKHVAVFRLPNAKQAKGLGGEYVVAVDDAENLDLTALLNGDREQA